MTLNDERNFTGAFERYNCHRRFNRDNVREHDHLTRKYRGGAHERCHLMLRKTDKLAVFFQNFRDYDSHMIVWVARSFTSVDTNLIGQGMEKYLTLGSGEHLVFKDSLQFLRNSLETLESNLLRSVKDMFKQLGAYFQVNAVAHPHCDMDHAKGVFLYEQRDAWEKMNEPALAGRVAFFSHLNNEPCSEAV